jgi:hypothetical protein
MFEKTLAIVWQVLETHPLPTTFHLDKFGALFYVPHQEQML